MDNDDPEEERKRNWEKIRYRGGRPEEYILDIGIKELCNLFKISRTTLWRWIKSKKFDPTNLKSIAEFYYEKQISRKT